MYTAFFFSGTGESAAAPAEIPGWGPRAWEMFGANLLNTDSAAVIGVDPKRPVVMSTAIVDPARLRELLASPKAPPADVSFVIRILVVVPVIDPARAQAALDVLMRESVCARPRRIAARWASLLDRLREPEDRRTAETSDAAYLCMTDMAAIVVRINEARRELRWTVASGEGSVLTAAAAPVRPARELADRLQRDGFFSARMALFKLPGEDARAAIALGLIKTRAGIAGVDQSQRDRLWQRSVQEVTAAQRLVDSPPALFSGFLGADGAISWILTKEGRELFASPAFKTVKTTKGMKEAIAKTLRPGGAFTDASTMLDEIHKAGSSAELLIRHMLWPHILAVEATFPPGAPQIATDFDDERARVEIDLAAGRVRLRHSDAP